MSRSLEEVVISAVDMTLSAGSARFRCSISGEAGQLASCEGTVDFRRVRSAMDLRFAFPDSVSAHSAEMRAVTDGATVYVRVPSVRRRPGAGGDGSQEPDLGVDRGGPERWMAFHDPGISAVPIGAIKWLRGVTGAERIEARSKEGLLVERFAVDLDLESAVRRSPERERHAVRSMLERSQPGLVTATTHGEVDLDRAGRIRRMRVAVPPGISNWFLVATPERSMEIEFYEFSSEVSIAIPEADIRMSADDFLDSITVKNQDG